VAARVRRIREDEWAALRTLRLTALADAPHAFETRFAEAAAWPESTWVDRARAGATDPERTTFVAEDGEGGLVGMCTVYAVGGSVPEVVGVFVAAAHRGTGVVDALLGAAAGWAADPLGADQIVLHVHDGNDRAAAAYRRLGFVPTGGVRTSASGGWNVEMVRRLGT
jgi:RimJ/RimL family protein N-acetyltransferase